MQKIVASICIGFAFILTGYSNIIYLPKLLEDPTPIRDTIEHIAQITDALFLLILGGFLFKE
jgi:hypothetical protein